MKGPFDPREALRVLTEHGVEFVVIGGIAAAVHGAPVPTFDVDVCYRRDPENIDRLVAALRELRAYLAGAPEGLPFQLDAKTIANSMNFTFDTTAGELDCLGDPAGVGGYEGLIANAERAELGGLEVAVCALEDLIRMKRAAGRPKDQQTLPFLDALLERIEERRKGG